MSDGPVVTIRFGRCDLVFPAGYEDRANEILFRKRPRMPGEESVKRVLDLGAGCGEFAVWAWRRWPNCWITSSERDPVKRKLLHENKPPGCRVLEGESLDDVELSSHDVVRVGDTFHLFRIWGWSVVPMVKNLLVDVEGWGR